MKAELSLWIVPTLGVLSLATAGVLRLVLPRERQLGELLAHCAQLDQRSHELRATTAPSQDEDADLLPLHLTLGEVVHEVQERARLAGITGITLSSDDGVPAPGDAPATGPRGAPAALPPAAGSAPQPAGADKVPEPKSLRCRIQARAGFLQIVRFLGSLEAGAPLMRVKALEVVPTEDGVQANFVLESFWYPRPSDQEIAATPVR